MLLALIGLIPGLLDLFKSWQAARLNAQVEMYKSKTGADTETAKNVIAGANAEGVQNVARLQAVASNKWLTFLFVFMSMPVGLYIWEVVFVDKIACKWIFGATCSTDPITGDAAVWVNLIIMGTFGSGAAMGIAKHWFASKKD